MDKLNSGTASQISKLTNISKEKIDELIKKENLASYTKKDAEMIISSMSKQEKELLLKILEELR